ncbi:MAG: hypothetical protein JXR65_03300 [Bacteroidales bacterium]|nr:hypothetical protein [Bacteroidales bacterium]
MRTVSFKPFLFLVLLSTVNLFPISISAQKSSQITVEHADSYNYNARLGKNIQRLIGHVRLRQDSTLFMSDSAYLNDKDRNFDGFGNVHINVNDTLNIYGDRIHYNGKTKVAELFGKVTLQDPKAKLTTSHLIYNRQTQIAYYDAGGTIFSDTNVLKSTTGYYNTKTHIFHFRKNVRLKSPDQETYSDTLIYNSNNGVAVFQGPTTIKGKETTLIGTSGWYDTRNEISRLYNHPEIQSKSQTLIADSLFYNNNTTEAKAYGNIYVSDTSRQLIVRGETAQMWDNQGKMFITRKAQAITYDSEDSLYMHADTLWLYFDKKRDAKKLLAYHDVRFYRTDLQGVCDSLSYTMKDSTMRLFTNPVLWSGKNQLSADTIFINISKNQVDSMTMAHNAFIIDQDSTDYFNQIKGRDMVAYFRNNRIYLIVVDGNAQSVYWARDDHKKLIGINKAESGFMHIHVKENQIVGINYIDKPSETLYPKEKLPGDVKKLRGFNWKADIRPKNKEDIFRKIPKQEDKQQLQNISTSETISN